MTPPRTRRSRALSEEDQRLWAQIAATVTPRVRRKAAPPQAPAPHPAPRPAAEPAPAKTSARRPGAKPAILKPAPTPEPAITLPKPQATKPSGLDGKREDRFRKGQLEIEARIDLHGLTLDLAHAALGSFLLQARARGHRIVLVITGKGNPTGEGAIKRLTPRWLAERPYSGMIASIAAAQPRHGGSGALYVYLRRKRT
jgi:DNA-nicking Smr family endonuclease